jgi:hypothetical protein
MLVASNREIQEQTMYSTPEIYLQAELQYHREQIRRSFLGSRLARQGKPVWRRSSSRLARRTTTPAPASR